MIRITITITIGNLKLGFARHLVPFGPNSGVAMNPVGEIWFSHEKLDVYREAIIFVAWLSDALEKLDRLGDVKDQLDRASTSIVLNTAEGNGKFNPKDRCRFFDIAHASALECAAGLDITVAKRRLTIEEVRPGKERLQRIVRMLMGLIKKNSNRDYEKNPDDVGQK